ncbi:alpha-glucosidase-like [Phlebotomus argentipes]|uniref:alpha-glucosidase-like n=1 Tax=Phlebotomus argentipes TaxID=94469 RepID=UPI0028934356|nr:alpha-glucosidase-like [Phlebotomus argentipes]
MWKFIVILFISATFCASAAVEVRRTYDKQWYEHATFYQVYPRSFKDNNGDGVGDLPGITSKLEYLQSIGINAIWLSPCFQSPMVDNGYDVSDFKAIHDEFGTMADYEQMISVANELGIKIMLDFVPNHSSDKHEWFERSIRREAPYTDFYVWHDGRRDEGGNPVPPNNWVSVFGGPAWTWVAERGQFYLHQFYPQQPDLNYRNPRVLEEMKEVLIFWMERGAAGFRLDAINHMFESPGFEDEPLSGWGEPGTYDYLEHVHTKDLLETYDVVEQFRQVVDNYAEEHQTEAKILMTEAYANLTFTMMFYQSDQGVPRAHMPFNFGLINDVHWDTSVRRIKEKIDEWLDNMPPGHTPNWVAGSHDHSRVGSRLGVERIGLMNTLVLTLPGTSITYYGEEIGMLDFRDFDFWDSRDPNRTPMQWDDSAFAGFTSGSSTWLPVHPGYATRNVELQSSQERSHLQHYKQLTALRKLDTFAYGDFLFKLLGERVFGYIRVLPNNPTYLMVFNFHNQEEHVDLSVFASVSDSLSVVSCPIESSYKPGDIVGIDNLQLGPYDALVLKASGGNLLSPAISLFVLVLGKLLI